MTDKKNIKERELKKRFDIQKINQLPEDMINEIIRFIPSSYLTFTDKINYELNHASLREDIIKKNVFESYVRDMVRRDNDFVFSYILRENYGKWLIIKNYPDNHVIYENYISFLISYCINNKSERCRNVLTEYIERIY